MKLRHKALVIVGVTLIGLNLGLLLIASTILRRSFQQVEEERMEELVSDTLTSLNQVINQFNVRFADWAAWNDTVEFAQGQKPDYVDVNLNPAAINLLQIDLVAVLNVQGRLVYGSAFDTKTQSYLPLPPAFQDVLVPGHPLLQHPSTDSDFGGFLVLPEGILLLSSRPILNDEGEGPVQGTLIFGRYINSQEMVRLSKTIGRPLRLQPLQSEGPLPPPAILNSLSQTPGAIATMPLSESNIAGYTLLTDVTGRPAILMQITSPRMVHTQYHVTVKYLAGAILVLDGTVAIATILLLEHLVISRITHLNQEVSSIQISEGGFSNRVSILGQDELAGLGGAINQMLEAIEAYERDRQRTAAVLERARFEAEAASRAKSQFLGNMSHELRTPLTAILGYSEVLALELQDLGHTTLSDDVRKIERSGHHLLDLIKDMLDLSRLDTDSLNLCVEPFNVLELVQQVSQKAETWAAQNDNQLILRCATELGIMYSDAKRLRQCLLNVLNNACKFTQGGVIILAVENDLAPSQCPVTPELWLSDSCFPATITFSISDTGIGIAPDQLQRIFELFTQADETNTRRYGGTGLGLAITQRLCDALGGTITVDSQPDRGTTFTMQFPCSIVCHTCHVPTSAHP